MELSAETMDIMRSFSEALGMLMLLSAIIAIVMNRLNATADDETVARRSRKVPYLVSLMIPLVIVIMRPHVYVSLTLICLQALILVMARQRAADSDEGRQ